MDFNGRLEDVKKVLTTMGPRYAARLDKENMILTLVRKLPNESLKRKWTDIASDIIQITTYAFQNNGSDATLCLRGLLEESGLESESTDFRLTTVNHEGKEYGRRASLKIEALDGKTKFTLDQVLTTERLPIGEKHFTNNRELRKWPHLDGIYLPQVDERKVSILIGSNRPDIIDNNSEIRRRTQGQSYAVNTPLG